MRIEKGNFCPLIKKDCVGIKCAWFTQVRGTNPNTGEQIDEWECAINWIPLLVMENTQQERQAGAAIESMRNEIVQSNKENQNLYISAINSGVIPAIINSPMNILESGTKNETNLSGE